MCAMLALQVSTTVKIMLDILQGQRGDAGSRYVALLALGEVGRTTDLSGYDGVSQAVTGALEGSSLDELRTAASSALGGLAVGSTSAFLPFILQQIQAQVFLQHHDHVHLLPITKAKDMQKMMLLPPHRENQNKKLFSSRSLPSSSSRFRLRFMSQQCGRAFLLTLHSRMHAAVCMPEYRTEHVQRRPGGCAEHCFC